MELGFFPLDEQLELLPGGLTPFIQECLVRLGAWMPFQQASQLLEDMLGVAVSKAQAVRLAEAAGEDYVAQQTQEADRIEREAPPVKAGSQRLVMSVDGAMVPLRGGEWGEVRTLAVGEVQGAERKGEEWGVRTEHISYFSRLVSAEQFEHLTLTELHRRGLEKSRQVAAVMDGADWLQSFVDYHCPMALRILDFPHAAQRIGQIGQALLGEDSPETSPWIEERLHQLKHHGPGQLLEELRNLHQQHAELEILTENLAYLEKRELQMHYPQFQEQGWPIGSGMVESGNKLVVEARLKGAGMHWERKNVNSMLGLRNIVCSDRWSEEWPQIAIHLRQQARQRRNRNQPQDRLAKLAATPPGIAQLQAAPLVELPKEPSIQPLKQPKESGSKKPAANHPWRHSPIGRGRFEPSKPANN